MPQPVEVKALELLHLVQAELVTGLGVLHQQVLCLEGTQPVLQIVLAQHPLLVELAPSHSFRGVVLKHPEYHALNISWQLLVGGEYFTCHFDVFVVVDVVPVIVDLLQHLVRLEEREGNLAIAGVKELVGDDAHRPDVHFLVVPVILGVYLRGVVAEGAHLRVSAVNRGGRDAKVRNHTGLICSEEDVPELDIAVDDEARV